MTPLFVKKPLTRNQAKSLLNESSDDAIHVIVEITLADWFKYIEETSEPATNYLSTLICGFPILNDITYHIVGLQKDKLRIQVNADPCDFIKTKEEQINMDVDFDPLDDDEEEE